MKIGGISYFAASDGVHGRELWKSDGTAVGTVMVKDLIPGNYGFIKEMHAATDSIKSTPAAAPTSCSASKSSSSSTTASRAATSRI